MVKVDKICFGCGEMMYGVSPQKWYCSECRARLRLEAAKQRAQEKKAERLFESEEERRKKHAPQVSIVEIREICREKGMTYSQVVRWLETAEGKYELSERRKSKG